MESRTYRVSLMAYQIIGGVGVLFSVGCIVGAFIAKQYGPISVFALFGLFGVYIILGAGNFEISGESISHKTFLGHFRIFWRDVQKIEFSGQGTLVFHGENKRFVVSPPGMWSGKDKSAAFSFLKTKIEEIGVVPYPSNVADYKINKNVRFRED